MSDPAPRTIDEMQAFAADIHARCKPREGYVAKEASLFLNERDIQGIDAIARFLAIISPFRSQILDLVNGTAPRKFGRRS
ncbi:MAG: hypothetical protein K2Y29_15520 [Beijerinckiaceae bacterium]|nr:hypothetical protein [Beijerinckiaceae bacterium]